MISNHQLQKRLVIIVDLTEISIEVLNNSKSSISVKTSINNLK